MCDLWLKCYINPGNEQLNGSVVEMLKNQKRSEKQKGQNDKLSLMNYVNDHLLPHLQLPRNTDL